MNFLPFAYLLDWGWLRIGPPYIYVNINPILVQLGPLAVRWYGLMYVVGILIGLQVIRKYCDSKGISQDMVYRVLWWCIGAGLIGGRLYFVIQQPDLVQRYLMHPINIIATWEGGMAFFGAIFLILPTLYWRARVDRLNPLVLIDAGVLFGSVGQIFGRIGNLINGDIIGYPSTLPWSTVYQNPNSWACLDISTCNVPVQPAAGYEMILNIILLALMLYLARRVRRPGVLMLVYLFSYAITQFFVFFVRANTVVNFLGTHILKQAQWTSVVVFILLLPLTYVIMRISKPVPVGEVAITYGIPQLPKAEDQTEDEMPVATDESDETAAAVADEPALDETEETEQEEESAATSADEVESESTDTEVKKEV
ncbi:MAG TPA: prolipoprotein diacylglyceryl transferase [Dictyobacter sp.]|jgi:phosphatidylglycerol:prolipoprotein diacylglycerol transferase|nr:prolipoprotein diacylglyceryl transferase [Dictyobacter sp.]